MSIQRGLVSPPLSGRTYKTDVPRVSDIHKVVNAVDVFGNNGSAVHHAMPSHSEHHAYHHTIRSPVKVHHDKLSDADRAVRPLTPPMSKDVRHDQQAAEHNHSDDHHRTNSGGDHYDAPVSSSSMVIDVEQADCRGAHQRYSFQASASRSRLMAAAPIGNSFRTLNQGVGFESDDEHNPFLDRQPPATSSASETSKHTATNASHAHHSHPYYDEFDSDQDAEGSVDGDSLDRHLLRDATPRASSSNATTPPPRARQAVAYRPARPFSERVRVDNESVASTMPIRDTPKNPFLAGGPADNGFQGPNRREAYSRAKQIPAKERGKIAYVFRGQRVTYADPEYDSDDDDDSELDEMRARTNEFNPHHNAERPPRLQPRLLFPPSASISAPRADSSRTARPNVPKQHSASQHSGSRRDASSTAYAPHGVHLVEDEFGGATSSSSYDEEDGHAEQRTGGGLFAAQIAAQRQQAASHNVQEASRRAEATAPSSSARLQSVTNDSHNPGSAGTSGRLAARDALLARLDQTNWSDDDDDDDDDDHRSDDEPSHGHAQHRRAEQRGDEARVDTDRAVLARSQSHRKRLSDELQPGHEAEVDVLGRAMKRSRASYAY